MDSGLDDDTSSTEGRHAPSSCRASEAMRWMSVAIFRAPGRSALLMTKISAISMMPAFIACTTSPLSGSSSTSVSTWKRLHLEHHSLYEILQILSLSMFETSL